ncbi:hypothetical protein V565_255240, partial [Rhizoctonia solani 123E]
MLSAATQATQATHALSAKSAFESLSSESERSVNIQASSLSSQSRLIDSPQTRDFPDEQTPVRETRLYEIHTLASNISLRTTDKLTNQDNSISDWLGTSSHILVKESDILHNPGNELVSATSNTPLARASTHLCYADLPQEVPAEPPPDQFVHSYDTPTIVSSSGTDDLDSPVKDNDIFISSQLDTPLMMPIEDSNTAQNSANTLAPTTSVATHTTPALL